LLQPVAGVTLVEVYLPDPVVQELSGFVGFDFALSFRHWINGEKSQFPDYLDE
jgi:hypothetical protein